MAQFFEPSTDTDANFANSVSGQDIFQKGFKLF